MSLYEKRSNYALVHTKLIEFPCEQNMCENQFNAFLKENQFTRIKSNHKWIVKFDDSIFCIKIQIIL